MEQIISEEENLIKGKHKKRIEGILSHKMRGLLNFVWDRNKKSDKTLSF